MGLRFNFGHSKTEKIALFQLLLQTIKLRSAEKLPQCDIQPIANHFNRYDFRVVALAIKDILYGRGRQT